MDRSLVQRVTMSNTDHMRVGLIGAGFIGGYHVDGIRAAGFGDVTVLVGRDADRAARRGESRRATAVRLVRNTTSRCAARKAIRSG